DRRFPAGQRGRHPHRRHAGRRAGSRPRHRVPALRAVPVEDGEGQRALRPGKARPAEGGARGPRAEVHRPGRLVRLRGELPVAALGRDEAARRDRAHARDRPDDAADGRALRRARRPDAQPDAVGAARHLATLAQDGDLRHPRCAGGGLPRAARGGDVGAPGKGQGGRGDEFRPRRSAPVQVEGLRRAGRRDLGPGARRGAEGARQAPRMKRLLDFGPLLLLAVLWEASVRLHLVSADLLPPLSAVLKAWWQLAFDPELWRSAAASLYRGGAGLALAIVVGGALGVAMAWWRPVNALVSPLVEALYPLPKSALIPVTALWLGFGDGSKILLIFLGCMLPVTLGA